MKKQVKVKRRKDLTPLPEGVTISGLVSYYYNGWRVGHLKSVEGNYVSITPMGANEHRAKNSKLVPISDIKKIE